ncbi:fructose-1,6-bisphosphatase [Parasporobacterium paucivorans]|uniref:Fructose-1,6-bisphosphatase class 3 n=1 Tax=Parasporobacterium paucivorans DSM 15970 TaxID=1122934 RepID=A0A1M6CB94_9FIRM|nr:fructose-1,6-bisphosphatase [Parasporobacterium paucivorans]SHI58266.1 fructose-1,6-bisphosphatase-3 [Parasporobacterium paucivorans DSM 15970]
MSNIKYLELLAKDFPNISAVANEIINLKAIRRLPKGTEYFISDLHGEYEAFSHILRSASGIIRTKVNDVFESSITDEECNQLAILIYYPERFQENLKLQTEERKQWEKVTIHRLIQICKMASTKYTRSKVRKKIPACYAYVIDELLHAEDNDYDKKKYYNEFIYSLVDVGIAGEFITAICDLIQKLSVDRLHIVGDIFDRGARPDKIMNELIEFENLDIQWGNHDISWMGAATGNRALMANVIRICLSYNSFDLLEDGYGINLRALSEFAEKIYSEDPCEHFMPHLLDQNETDFVDENLTAKMHKAIAVIQFKLEGQLIKRHPEYNLDDRILIEQVDYANGTLMLEGKSYVLRDRNFPTLDPKNPLQLSREEEELMRIIAHSFESSEQLHRHVKFLYSHGNSCKCINSNLLFHGCIPMTKEGEFDVLVVEGDPYKGKDLFKKIDEMANDAYFLPRNSKLQEEASDFMWYIWCGPLSPVFGKDKITTYENYFIGLKETKHEELNPYFKLSQNSEEICCKIFEEFGIDPEKAHIINGHVPVKYKDGENPVKANGKLFVIDGGIAKAYQPRTGIAGYTLIFNSRHLSIAEHKPFKKDLSGLPNDNTPNVRTVDVMKSRVTVADTDTGKELQNQINDLTELLDAYKKGIIKEKV